MRSKLGIPSSSQATASPSMMQERERNRARASTISGKRCVMSLPGRGCRAARGPVLARDDAEAIVLDLVQPSVAAGRLRLDVQFSRIQLSRRRYPLSGDGRDQIGQAGRGRSQAAGASPGYRRLTWNLSKTWAPPG